MFFHGKRILFVGAHPDDIELGCGAFIARALDSAELRCVTLSDNGKLPEHRQLIDEHHKSMSALGVPPKAVVVRDFETRRFSHARQEILDYLIQQKQEFRPDIAFVHSRADLHQDHQTVSEEALRAFRGLTVLGFETLRSSNGFFPHFLVEVSEEDVERKLRALAEYKTYAGRQYLAPDVLKATMIRHGVLAETPFAEGFDVLRVVGRFEHPAPSFAG